MTTEDLKKLIFDYLETYQKITGDKNNEPLISEVVGVLLKGRRISDPLNQYMDSDEIIDFTDEEWLKVPKEMRYMMTCISVSASIEHMMEWMKSNKNEFTHPSTPSN